MRGYRWNSAVVESRHRRPPGEQSHAHGHRKSHRTQVLRDSDISGGDTLGIRLGLRKRGNIECRQVNRLRHVVSRFDPGTAE